VVVLVLEIVQGLGAVANPDPKTKACIVMGSTLAQGETRLLDDEDDDEHEDD
jgi:hypothetical protein